GFASREWFYAACQVARVRPRVFLESAAPQTLIALTTAGYGIAVIPSSVQIPPGKVHAVPLVHRGASIGRWNVTAWDPQRSLAPYAVQFIEELTVYTRRQYPNRDLQGGCFCGRIRYEVAGRPFHETNCHCSICRRTTGAPFVAWFSVRPSEFRFVEGDPSHFR